MAFLKRITSPDRAKSKPRKRLVGVRRQWKKWRKDVQAFSAMSLGFSEYLSGRKFALFLAGLTTILYSAVALVEPWPLKMILDNVFLDEPLPNVLARVPLFNAGPDSVLVGLVGLIIVIGVLRGVAYYYKQVLTAFVGQSVAATIRLDLFNHIQRLSRDYHDYKKTGDLLSRITNDVRVLRQVLIAVPLTLLGDLFLVVAMATVMFLLDWRLTFLALAIYPAVGLVMRQYRRPLKHAVAQQREREGEIATIAAEVFGAIDTVQSFRLEDTEAKRFGGQNRRGLRSGLRAARIEARFNFVSGLVVALGTAAVMLLASQRVLSGVLTPGDLIVFVLYLRTFYRPLRSISRLFERAARGTTSGERLRAVLDRRVLVQDRVDATDAKRFVGAITFDHVTLNRGRRRDALKDVNLGIAAGEKVAIVGATGAGKTSLISLLSRFYDPKKGRVLIDGTDIRKYTLSSLRGQIALVFQDPILFATTVAENIGLGKRGSDIAKIQAAAKRAGVHAIIEDLVDGYETEVGERGIRLSGGQRQAVAIARAMLKAPSILVLDEPLSGLDAESARAVSKALDRLSSDRTVLIITHRLSAIERTVDRVIVMDHGSIVETGAPRELLATDGAYTKLYQSERQQASA